MRTEFVMGLLAACVAAQMPPPPCDTCLSATPFEIVELIDGILIGALKTE